MRLNFVVVTLGVIMAKVVTAATVSWDTFVMTGRYEYNGGSYSNLRSDDPIGDGVYRMGWPSVAFKYIGYSDFRSSTDLPRLMDGDWAMLIFAQAGDVLNWNLFASVETAFDNHIQFAYSTLVAETESTPIEMPSEEFYMAMIFWTDEGPGYAWFEFEGGAETLTLMASAATLSEGLIVGTGRFVGSTPEPSCGMLLLVGVFVSLLKRPRQSRHRCGSGRRLYLFGRDGVRPSRKIRGSVPTKSAGGLSPRNPQKIFATDCFLPLSNGDMK